MTSWNHLLAANVVQRHAPTKRELDDLRGVIDRNLADASVPGLSADNRLGIAYEAVLVSAKMVVHASGYRVRAGVPRAHAVTLECAELAMGGAVGDAVSYFDGVRRRRNTLSYDAAGTVSDTEANDAARHARSFCLAADRWVRANFLHPA